ncbi:hypothetical protein Tco_0436375 [Tanacetum coccineum]
MVVGCGLWPGWYWAAVLKMIERWAWAGVKLGREDGPGGLGWCRGEWWKKYWLAEFELGRLQLGCAFGVVKVARWPEMDKWQELGRVIRAVHERQAVARERPPAVRLDRVYGLGPYRKQ